MRFFRSLSTGPGVDEPKSAPVSDQPPRGDASLQLVATGVGAEREEPKEEQVAVLNFSMESILLFQNEHLIHKTIADPPKSPVRKRPNYDNRKRAFMAGTLPEKKKPPVCSKVTVFSQLSLADARCYLCPEFVIQRPLSMQSQGMISMGDALEGSRIFLLERSVSAIGRAIVSSSSLRVS